MTRADERLACTTARQGFRSDTVSKDPFPTRGAEFLSDPPARIPVQSAEDAPAPECATHDPLPRPFGDYELLEQVACGGMGVVYRARQRSLGRDVAVKMIRDRHLATDVAVQRFYQEARAAAALDHPGIVPIYEVGLHEKQPYFTMTFVEGTNLAAAVQRDGLPAPEAAASLVAAVADAVEFAHGHGIIHRDLKPANIMVEGNLGGSARPRVTDFGLAKCLGGDCDLTPAGEMLGTPCYMAPEQGWGDHRLIGPRSDVYALGGILYFLLTGRPPASGQGLAEVFYQMMECKPAPPRQLRPAVPEGLEAVCLRCLEKDPAQRYQTAGEVAEALRVWAANPSGTSSFAPPSHGRRWKRPLLTTAGLLAALAAVCWWAGSLEGPPGPETSSVTPVDLEPTYRDFELKVEMLGGRADQDGVYRLNEGQEVTFRIEVERDAYVGVWNVAPDGTIRQLFPNQKEADHLVRARQPRAVPQCGFVFEAEAAGGVEKVWVVASTWPWDVLQGECEGPFLVFKTAQERETWGRAMRDVRGFRMKPASKSAAKLGPPALTESMLTYHVSARKRSR